MYEEGTRIYDFVPDTLQYGKQQLRLLLDFGLKVGDKAFGWDDDREVIREDVISVKGHTYKRLTINTKDKSGEDIYWVESIGASNDFFITMIEKPTGYSLYKNMVSCYDKMVYACLNAKIFPLQVLRVSLSWKAAQSNPLRKYTT